MTGINRDVRDFILNGYAFQKYLDGLDELETRDLDSPLTTVEEIIEPFLDNFPDYKKRQAKQMSRYYEIIYLIETMLRNSVSTMLSNQNPESWWEDYVPEHIQSDVARLIDNEINAGISLRSKNNLDYTTFGQLVDIFKKNKDAAGTQFLSVQGLLRILAVLNNLRAPIAHNNILSPDEVARLYVAVRDLFRLRRLPS